MMPHGNLSVQNISPNAFNREERTVSINRFMRCLRYITFATTEQEGTVMKGAGDFAFCKSAFAKVVNGNLLFKRNFQLHIRTIYTPYKLCRCVTFPHLNLGTEPSHSYTEYSFLSL
jgi:hypothetical protein